MMPPSAQDWTGTLGVVAFERPAWWLLLPVLVALTLWLSRRSLSGLASRTRIAAIAVRVLVLTLLVGVLAEPLWLLRNEGVAVSVVLDVSRSMGPDVQKRAEDFLRVAGERTTQDDRLALVTVARESQPQALSRRVSEPIGVGDTGPTDATNLEAGVRLGLALMPRDRAARMLVISDGNETSGSLLQAAAAARAAGVKIDVLPRRFRIDREVIAERIIAPGAARSGETANLRVVLNSTLATSGRLSLLANGEPIDISADGQGLSRRVSLLPGTNVEIVPVRLPAATGPVRYEALFEPDVPAGQAASPDTLTENNRALGVTFVGGGSRVLVLSDRPDEARPLVRALEESRLEVELRPTSAAPTSLAELGAYEAIVLVNTPAFAFSQRQQSELRSYVHDLGGGLLMVGGDESFGAGGWIGSPLAEALPIKMDPPQKREMPRGALMLVMHSCEMPQGNFWARKTGEAAINALSSRDMAGIVEHPLGGGDGLVHPLSVLGNKAAAMRGLAALSFGDAPAFQPMLQTSYNELINASAGQKHIVIISDGDPAPPTDALLQQFIAARISISTVAVFPHQWGGMSADLANMRRIATLTGGNYHEITRDNQVNTLPEIFIKEARTVKRTLIWEGDAIVPSLVNPGVENMRGIRSLPALRGYIVGADREGLSQVILRGVENDPIMAQWQHGLGRAMTFTSDTGGRWASAWPSWGQYRAFWEQQARWVMRPAGSPNARVVTSEQGGTTKIVVEALDESGARMNFARWRARLVRPDLGSEPFELVQRGPGRYEATVPTEQAGSYMLNMLYEHTGADGRTVQGNVQSAISRPFADEFRALRDNAALLEQVAQLTGGRVLSENSEDAALWDAQGLVVPTTQRPIWLGVLIAALTLFLLDVGIRRVRIDTAAIARLIRAGLGRGKAASNQQVEALRSAREKARQEMSRRTQDGPARVGESVTLEPGTTPTGAGVKFEATREELRAARRSTDIADEVLRPGSPAPVQTRSEPKPAADGEGGMSRLLKAKKRAQDEMGDGGDGGKK